MGCAFSKTAPIRGCYPDRFWARLPSVQKIKIRLKFIPSFTDQTHILLTHCMSVRLSRNSYIWYPGWRRRRVLKYPQKYNFFVFVLNSTEVETAALKIFCVMIPLLFRVVRPNRPSTLCDAIPVGGDTRQHMILWSVCWLNVSQAATTLAQHETNICLTKLKYSCYLGVNVKAGWKEYISISTALDCL